MNPSPAACPLGSLCGPPLACIVGILVVAGIILFVIGKKKGWPCCGTKTGGAREILDTQYAEGKITKEEYEQKKKDLKS